MGTWRRIALAMTFGFILAGAIGVCRAEAAADNFDDFYKCPMSSEIKNREGALGWWSRRSAEQQRVVLALPCEERFVPLVCIFLYEPDLIGCTNKGIAEYRANKYCQAKCYDLLSQEMADCKQQFKKTFKRPFPPATS
jgi:hypothetical protein